MPTTKIYRSLILIAVLLALLVVGVGAYTRLTNAGLGCPDWPGCYGAMIVPDMTQAAVAYPDLPLNSGKAWTEMLHRYLAGTLMILIIAIAIYSWRQRFIFGYPVKLPFTILALVCVQALLGMWTVTWKLQPTIVMAHLMGGMFTLSLLWLLWLRVRLPLDYVTTIRMHHRWGFLALIFVIVQIALGGWVSANYAGVACPGFPQCYDGHWLGHANFNEALQLWLPIGPNYEFGALDNPARQAINLLHRFGAVAVLIVLGSWCLWLARIPSFRVIAFLTLGLLFIQIALGITNVVHHLPLHAAVTHNVVGALLLLATITLNYRVYIYQHK
jgi:cytochrome c oxidase assembly protein subunit 15